MQDVNLKIELATPGSVWVRKSNGTEVSILFISNSSLPEAAQKKHPVSVTYVDNNTKDMFTRALVDFFQLADFHHVDGALESRLEGLFLENPILAASFTDSNEVDSDTEAGDDDFDVDEDSTLGGLVIADEDTNPAFEGMTLAEEMEAVRKLPSSSIHRDLQPSNGDVLVVYKPNSVELPSALSPQALSEATVAYECQMSILDTSGSGDLNTAMLHKFIIRNDDNITPDLISSCFDASLITQQALFVPTVVGINETISWDGSYGVYPMVNKDGVFSVLVLVTEIDNNVETVKVDSNGNPIVLHPDDVIEDDSLIASELLDDDTEVELDIDPIETDSADATVIESAEVTPTTQSIQVAVQ